ncbi:hypothetical protein B4U79_10627 [Dinothrombium tinctorium]|uniref:Uncharacterized protein n=1 Tax=Dinothrombium tinctorium TaxID=1965070 RepID=A0A443RJ96_9ACAR|nr:hypothetical protein B4U79_10627 [Dinothrombium tinctorium]
MASFIVIITSICGFPFALAASNRTTIYAAGFFPLSKRIPEGAIGRGVLPAVNLALEHINNSPVLSGYYLELKYNDTKRIREYDVSFSNETNFLKAK